MARSRIPAKRDAVRASEIRDGSVGTSEIADGAITSSKLANPEYYAVVNGSNGALVRGSAGVTSGLSGGTGYRVNFVVDVSHCVWIATIGRHTPTAPGIFSIVPSDAGVYLSPIDGGGSPQSVFVATYLGGAPASSDFHLLIRC